MLDLADGLSRDGSVLIGMDVVLGVPKGYWQSVLDDRRRGAPKDFVDWLSSRGQFAGFFETVADPADWGVNRPWFEVRKGAGGLNAFTNKVRGGMRRRIDIAASLVTVPEILFLDEPTTGLDPRSRNQVWELVRRVAQDQLHLESLFG